VISPKQKNEKEKGHEKNSSMPRGLFARGTLLTLAGKYL
jgi:hypothetical protein